MRTRELSVRTKILALLFVPLLAVVALWVSATGATIESARSLSAARTYRDDVRAPAERLVDQLQQERGLSVGYLGGGRTDPRPLAAQRPHTDAALVSLRRHTSG